MKVALGKISSIQMGYSFRFGLEYMNRGEIAVIQMKNLAEDQVDCVNLLRIEMTQLKAHHLVQPGDLMFRSRGQVSTSAILITDPGPAVVAAPLLRIRADQNLVLPEYLNWYINQSPAQAFFESRARGSTQKIIGKEALESLEVDLPSLERQRTIAELAALAQEEQRLMRRLSELGGLHIAKLLIKMAQENEAVNGVIGK
ncbi:MAG: restriction endonuclease subunit S [Syntrophomonadaceae bacterium]|nr:restriction endonuclease subunit S [Syntrophomonadaceae bacterium]